MLQAYRKLDDMATKQTETLRKLTKQVGDLFIVFNQSVIIYMKACFSVFLSNA